MTRLVNKDDLFETAKINFISNGNYYKVMRVIDELPEVEAVPISFIRERMEGYYKNSYTEFGTCLETLIEDWRKEHGTVH